MKGKGRGERKEMMGKKKKSLSLIRAFISFLEERKNYRVGKKLLTTDYSTIIRRPTVLIASKSQCCSG
jgi:hypothetical protein